MRFLVFFVALLMTLPVLAAPHAKPSAVQQESDQQARVEKMQAQLEAVDRDVVILKEVTDHRLDAQDKRISDLGSLADQQGNHMSAIANVTTWVGTLITLIAIAAGFIIYFSMKERATAEAEKAAKIWFVKYAQDLRNQITDLESEASSLQEQIVSLRITAKKARIDIERNTTEVDDHVRQFRAAIDQAKQILAATDTTQEGHAIDPDSIRNSKDLIQHIDSKPEEDLTSADYFIRAMAEYRSKNFTAALLSLEKSLELEPDEAKNSHSNARLLFIRASVLEDLGKTEEAMSEFGKIDHDYSGDPSEEVRAIVAKSILRKGMLLGRMERKAEEIFAYDQILDRYDLDHSSAIRETVSMTLLKKSLASGLLENPADAIAIYDDIDRRFRNEVDIGTRVTVAIARIGKGVSLLQLNRASEAISIFDEIVNNYGEDKDPAIREQVARALVNKGISLQELDLDAEAIDIYDIVDQHYGMDENSSLRSQVARALVNKAGALGIIERKSEALAVYEIVERRYGMAPEPDLREEVAAAWNGRAFDCLASAKQYWNIESERTTKLNQAIHDLQRARSQCSSDDLPMILGNLGYAFFLSGAVSDAETNTRECLKLGQEIALKTQREDARMHRVEPQDTQYEQLLERLWAEVKTTV